LIVSRIVSGGQTGVDRAALDVALELGLPCGGWCPKGRTAEDGRIPRKYPVRETPSGTYAQRTRWNVRDSDGTLILTVGDLSGGTRLTLEAARASGKPVTVVDLGRTRGVRDVRHWLKQHSIGVLNVAGPRESTQRGMYLRSKQYLRRLLAAPKLPSTPTRDIAQPPPRRKGAMRMADIPPDVLAALNAGTLETATLAESLAIDFRTLLQNAAPEVAVPARVDLGRAVPYTQRLSLVGTLLSEGLGLDGLDRLRAHPSDTVRGWGAYLIAADPGLSLVKRLQLVRPIADDRHFGVRECAWLAVRPHIAADIEEAIRVLTKWTAHRSENVRRFASESTRPRGVWCVHLNELKVDPARALPLLEPLRADPSPYVQTSVANWLNDASKSQPAWVRQLCARWRRESPAEATRRICARALRTVRDRSAK
jgi:3-methyladenine DNA glycosylase AlkC